MTTPTTRTPVRIARGTYADLNASIADLLEGEICYATDEDKIYVVEGGALTSGGAYLNQVQSYTKAQRGDVVALTPGATVTPDFSSGNNYSLTLNANTTLANPTNLTAGQSGAIAITQDSSTAYTLAYGSAWKFEGGVPTFGTTLDSISTLAYYVVSSSHIAAKLISEPSS